MRESIRLQVALLAGCLILAGWNQSSSMPPSDDGRSASQQDNAKQSRSVDSPGDPSGQPKSSAPSGGTAAKASAETDLETRLAIKIALDPQKDPHSLDFDDSFRVILVNLSDLPLRIWNPEAERGFYQLSFEFVNARTGKRQTARRPKIADESLSDWYQNDAEAGGKVIEIAPKGEYTLDDTFGSSQGSHLLWTGLPAPNSSDRFSISACFISSKEAADSEPNVWSGEIQSEPVNVRFLASRLKTPHDYLEHAFPEQALEMLRAEQAWITHQDDYSRTPLHVAASNGEVEVVRWLLENGADVNAVAYNRFTPLHLADEPEVVALLLKKSSDLQFRDFNGETPLQRAAAELVNARNANEKRTWETIIELYRGAGVDFDILTAIHLNDLAQVKAILNRTPKFADDFYRQSPLRTAASLGRVEICRYLLEQHDVDVNDFERGVGHPIIKGALPYPEVVRLLIEHGADLKTRITWRGGGSGIWIIGRDATALHYAAQVGPPETIRLLIDNGVGIFATVIPIEIEDEPRPQTALEVAAFFGKADNASAIVNHPKFDQADEGSRKQALEKCLLFGVDYKYEWLCEETDRPKLVDVLLEKGALLKVNDAGAVAMRLAIQQIDPDYEDRNLELKRIVETFAKHGVPVDPFSAVAVGDMPRVARFLQQNPEAASSRRSDGYPALHFAAQMNYVEIVKALLKAGCNVDLRNWNERTEVEDETALHCAASWGRLEIAKELLHAGADVNATTRKKYTPLHYAVESANQDMIRWLLDNGARPDARDLSGKTPLDWASEHSHIENLFQEHGKGSK